MHLIILTLIITSLHCVYISYPLFTPPPCLSSAIRYLVLYLRSTLFTHQQP